MTPSDVAGLVPAVAGAVPVLIAAWRLARAGDPRRWWGRVSRRGTGAPAAAPECCTARVVIRYEPPEGGRLTVWASGAAPACGKRREECGPW
ncbi:hypothetical protein [Streptomyces purpureus]|uniref:Uncharacterized protein n=1 Tax=Streptomyces purpureus TaxID=1951 RepID=A0A918LP47_9ACTN|nr:hypothetical protein [Streptomyces purpureus]GGT30444.1 hypothetical protein GCM10014713_25070 [Streptomyces purpureus]